MTGDNIKGKVVIITGASSGLGRSTAKYLHQFGAKIVLAARRQERLDEIAKELSLPKEAAIQTDVSQIAQVENLMKKTHALYGRIDVLLNNAGVLTMANLDEAGHTKQWDQMIDINIKGVLNGITAVLPYMKKQREGQIINVSSVAGHNVFPGATVYSMTKAAVLALSEGLRKEVKPYNLRTTVISPGAVQTEIASSLVGEAAEMARDLMGNCAMAPQGFAKAVAYAISQPQDVDVNEIICRPTSEMF